MAEELATKEERALHHTVTLTLTFSPRRGQPPVVLEFSVVHRPRFFILFLSSLTAHRHKNMSCCKFMHTRRNKSKMREDSNKKEAIEWPASKVRSTFVDYFAEQHGHTRWKSSPCVQTPDDPTLLFVNAGMNQFKPLFLGKAYPSSCTFLCFVVILSQPHFSCYTYDHATLHRI